MKVYIPVLFALFYFPYFSSVSGRILFPAVMGICNCMNTIPGMNAVVPRLCCTITVADSMAPGKHWPFRIAVVAGVARDECCTGNGMQRLFGSNAVGDGVRFRVEASRMICKSGKRPRDGGRSLPPMIGAPCELLELPLRTIILGRRSWCDRWFTLKLSLIVKKSGGSNLQGSFQVA